MKNQGHFIVFEGIDGAGKSCQMEKAKEWCENHGYHVILTREPGGCHLGQTIRNLLLDPDHKEMAPLTELLLYAADRSQHVNEIIAPALAKNEIVLSDRFTLSTLAYQGYGRGLDISIIKKLNEIATDDIAPNLTIVVDIQRQKAKDRILNHREEALDRLEQEEDFFFEKVRQGYLAEAKKDNTIAVVNGDASPDRVFEEIRPYLENILCTKN